MSSVALSQKNTACKAAGLLLFFLPTDYCQSTHPCQLHKASTDYVSIQSPVFVPSFLNKQHDSMTSSYFPQRVLVVHA